MVVKKTIKMTQKIYPILGIVENMSHAICPHCNEVIEIFGQHQEKRLLVIQVLIIWVVCPDMKLNQLDEGKIEEYQTEQMEAIIEKIVAQLP